MMILRMETSEILRKGRCNVTRWGYNAGMFLPLFVIAGQKGNTNIWVIMCAITILTTIYGRCNYVGIHALLKKIVIIVAHFIPILNIIVYIWMMSLSKGAYDDENAESCKSRMLMNKLCSNLKVLWVLIFCVLSIAQMFFIVPYTTHLPASVAKNDKAGWNSYNGYGTFSYKPYEVPKKYKQYTDINYQRLTMQEAILGVICVAGYAITFTMKK